MSATDLYARQAEGFEARAAHALAQLREAARRHPGSVLFATSLGAEDMVITDLIASHRLPIAMATLDTGKLHAQTLALLALLALLAQEEQRYGLNIERVQPSAEQVIQFTGRHGEMAMRQSVELRKACCQLRKLAPLARLLQGCMAWVTGLRREQTGQRAEVAFQGQDGEGRDKFNPLADWSWADVTAGSACCMNHG